MKFSTDNLLATAKIHGTFSYEGFVKVESFSGEIDHILDLDKVFLEFPERHVVSCALQNGWYEVEEIRARHSDILLKFVGIDDDIEAKQLRGAIVFIPRDKAPHLDDGEFYANDLCYCELVYDGSALGKITGVLEGGSSVLLELTEAATERKVLIPFNSEFIGKIDLEKRTVELMHRWILE